MVCGNLIADGSNGTSTVRAEKSAEHTGPLAFRLLRSLNGTDTDRSDTYDGDGPSERNPIRTKAFFDLIERKISF